MKFYNDDLIRIFSPEEKITIDKDVLYKLVESKRLGIINHKNMQKIIEKILNSKSNINKKSINDYISNYSNFKRKHVSFERVL